MLLAIDVGNSEITIAVFEEDNIKHKFRLTTKISRTSDELGVIILNHLNSQNIAASDICDAIICSVVPDSMHAMENAIRKYFDTEPMIVGPGIKTGLRIGAENPKEIGADLIVNAVAAIYYYSAPIIIVDYGTATTYQYISGEGVYEAATICPGIKLMAKAMGQGTAKLPDIEIKKPKSIMGRETISAVQAGIVYSSIGQTEYIVNKMKEESKEDNITVIATGGLGSIISGETECIDIYDKSLTMKGLLLIFKMNQEKCKKDENR